MASNIIKQNVKWGILVAILASAIFGAYPAASRAAYADGANAVFLLWVTTFFRAILLVFSCLVSGKSIFNSKDNIKNAFKSGFFQALFLIGIMTSLIFISGPLLLIIVSMNTVLLYFFLVLKKKRGIHSYIIIAMVSAVFGLSLVLNLWEEQSNITWVGVALAFVATIATASRFYIFEDLMKKRNPMVVGAESFVVASVLVLPLIFLDVPTMPSTLSGFGWVALSALSLSVGIFGTFYGVAMIGAFRWSLFAHTQLIFTAIFSVWFMGEVLNISQYIGMGIVIASLITYQVISHRKERAARCAVEACKGV